MFAKDQQVGFALRAGPDFILVISVLSVLSKEEEL
jgi:hypothetical protein